MIVRRLILAAALAAPLAACGGDTSKSAADTSAPAKPVVSLTVGSNAPVYEATTLDSAALKFGGVADSVVLLNVWATWCTSCREEFAELEQLRLTRGPSGVRVVAVSVDQGGSEKVRRFVQAQGTHFPVAQRFCCAVRRTCYTVLLCGAPPSCPRTPPSMPASTSR